MHGIFIRGLCAGHGCCCVKCGRLETLATTKVSSDTFEKLQALQREVLHLGVCAKNIGNLHEPTMYAFEMAGSKVGDGT